ncbi:MAG: hypothetical protein M3Q36_02335 [bacterium]|nr:hypothetical protein [bacterium]
MQIRNPLFVAGFPYVLITIGYFVLLFLSETNTNGEINDSAVFPMLGALIMVLVGVGYSLYWYISTAKVLRQQTNLNIPNAILLIIPLISYLWMWRYSKAVEVYTNSKYQTALAFVLLALLGPIGMGILQDVYNKLPPSPDNKPDVPITF